MAFSDCVRCGAPAPAAANRFYDVAYWEICDPNPEHGDLQMMCPECCAEGDQHTIGRMEASELWAMFARSLDEYR